MWPSEVEAQLYQHPAVVEACVIGTKDPYRGETVKALIVLRPEWRGRIEPQQIVDALPKSGSGKIMWRELQERERQVRAFIDAELPPALRDKVTLGRRLSREDLLSWQKILYRQGWGAVMWPERFGGTGWSVIQQHIFEEERAKSILGL